MVEQDCFSVTLNFGDQPEHLLIPYDAILTFVDPSVEFGLRFESHEDEDDEEELAPFTEVAEVDEAEDDPDDKTEAEVVSLDSFRK